MSNRPKTLIVLGDASFAAAMVKFLGARGFDPALAKTSTDALDLVKSMKPDVVVASQLLPGMDGVQLCKNMKKFTATPFLIIAAVSSPAGLTDVKNSSGADNVLPATFQQEALVTALRKLTTPPAEHTPSKGVRAATPSKGSPVASTPSQGTAPAPLRPQPPGPQSSSTAAIEEMMRTAMMPDEPPRPVQHLPDRPAVASGPRVPIDPAWLISRALVDRVTGALRFVNGEIERIVYFAQGRPIVVTSNVAEERIGQILIRKGKMTPTELEQALQLSKKKGKRLAEIIVEMGVMTMRDHDEELAEQYAERLLAIFAWREASVEFQPHPAPQELVQIRLAPERVVTEGMRRHYDAARLEHALHDPFRVLMPVPGAAERLPYLNLSQIEVAGLLLVDGRRTIADVAAQSPSRIDALRAIYASICLSLVT